MATDTSKDRSPLIVIGMHRSGTSLAAALLESAGLHIGDRLMDGNWSNPRGHFEDMDFVEFQRAALVRLGWHQDGWVVSDLPELPEDVVDGARALLEKKQRGVAPWGWKDPRTLLFLPLWLDLLPDSKLCLIYRAPWEVIDSLYRRGDAIFTEDPEVAVRMWLRYNRKLLDVVHANPERCLLVSLETLAADADKWIAALSRVTGLPLTTPNTALYEAELLHGSQANDRADALFRHYPEAVELYAALESRAWRPPELEPSPPWARGATADAERRLAMRDWHGMCAISAECERLREELRRTREAQPAASESTARASESPPEKTDSVV
jgi:hypothetical protein